MVSKTKKAYLRYFDRIKVAAKDVNGNANF